MGFGELKLKPPKPNSKTKFEKLFEQFKAAKAKSPNAFDKLIRETVAECKQTIIREYSVPVPNYEIILCDNPTFEKLLAEEPMHGGKPSSFIDRAKGIIVINIEEKLIDT